jgi:THO complex subunit 3
MPVEKISFCPTTEHLLASTGHDGGVRLWDVRMAGGVAGAGKGTQLADCKLGDPGLFLTWHPNGQEMLVGTKGDSVYSVDLRNMGFDPSSNDWAMDSSNRTPSVDKTSSPRYYGMCFSNSGNEVFATTGDGPVKILDYPSMSPLHSLSGHSYATYTVQHSPRGDWLAVGGGDSIITLWDTHDWHTEHALTGHSSAVRDISFSFDGAYLVAGSGTDARDGSSGIEVYHTDTGDVAHTIDTNNPVTVIAWHPYKYWLAYGGDQGGLKIIGQGTPST